MNIDIKLHKKDLPDQLVLGDNIAIDCEFMGLNVERDKLCLVQISTGKKDAHIIQLDRENYEAPNLKKVERPKAKRSRAKPQTPKAPRAPEQKSTNQQQANTTQAQPPVKPQAQPTAYNKTPVSLKQYNPPTLKGVPTRRNTPTFGGRTKPMQPQRFTLAPTNPFEIVQGQYKKPLILGLKIFGGIFAGFLLLICVCCGLLSS